MTQPPQPHPQPAPQVHPALAGLLDVLNGALEHCPGNTGKVFHGMAQSYVAMLEKSLADGAANAAALEVIKAEQKKDGEAKAMAACAAPTEKAPRKKPQTPHMN